MTDQASPGLKRAEDLFKSLAWDALVKGVLIAFKADFWPANVILMLFTDKLFEIARLQFDFAAITFMNAEHKAMFDRADVTLKIIARDKGIDSPEFKAAKEHAKIALSKFVRYGATG